jgi:hypothetical protein
MRCWPASIEADRRANECGAPQAPAATLKTTAIRPKSTLRNYRSVRPRLPSAGDLDDGYQRALLPLTAHGVGGAQWSVMGSCRGSAGQEHVGSRQHLPSVVPFGVVKIVTGCWLPTVRTTSSARAGDQHMFAALDESSVLGGRCSSMAVEVLICCPICGCCVSLDQAYLRHDRESLTLVDTGLTGCGPGVAPT